MAHQIENMAYVGQTPWHGLGNQLTPHQPIEVWAQQAGMDWQIESSNVSYMGLCCTNLSVKAFSAI